MSNATDSIVEAEEMIRSTFSKIENQEIVLQALQICNWLLSFNGIEKEFKVKCYSTEKCKDICFCIDRFGYRDCEGEKVYTYFYRIRRDKQIFRPISINPSSEKYLQRQTDTDHVEILSSKSYKPDIEILKKHIFESYEWQLNKMRLVSNVSGTNNATQQTSAQPHDISYFPNKEDIDVAESQLRKTSSDEVIDVETVLDQILINFEKAGKPLKENWREATKQNIKIWFCN